MADDDLDANGDDLPKQPPANKPPTKPANELKRLSSSEREICVKDMKSAPDLPALQRAVKDAHALANSIDDKESKMFFNDCYKQCESAFNETYNEHLANKDY